MLGQFADDGTVSIGTGAGSALGDTSIGSDAGGGSGQNIISAQKVTTTTGGTISSMSAYIGVWGYPGSTE